MSVKTLRARWVVPVTTPPLENGCVTIADGVVGLVGDSPRSAEGEVFDLGDAILLPGFVNAHTHLALSVLRGRVPFPGSFTGWVTTLRTASESLANEPAFNESMRAGVRDSLKGGVTAVADIGYGHRSVHAWREAPMRVFGFLEVLGMGPKRWGGHLRTVEQAIEAIRVESQSGSAGSAGDVRLGLSPHAPYSTDSVVYRNAIRTSNRLCTHLAETREELQFLRDGTGPFREMLEELGLWDGSFHPPECSPIRYMQQIGLFQVHHLFAPLLAHVNYVSDEDLQILADSPAHVVYCPRTHAFFGHEPHRYRDMLARGINVCLGTDSLASNDTLSMIDELRFLRSIDQVSTNDELLAMATVNGARALGNLQYEVGSERRCMSTDWIAVPLDNPSTCEPLEDLFRSEISRVSHVFVRGAPIDLTK